MYRFNSLEQSQETSNIIGLCAWSKHSSIMSSLCRCFSRPADPELLPATLSTTYTPVDPGQDDVDDVKDVVGDNEKTVNKQFASEPDFRRFCHHKDQMFIMHRPRRSFEMVLQEVCVQHHSVDTMRNSHLTEVMSPTEYEIVYCNNNNDNNNNNNNNNNGFLSTVKTIIHDASIKSPSILIKIPENFQNQNVERFFL
ncbi:kinesin family member 12, putative [Brugia malayi]|uniref:Kinesin family member 12, putative n=1 Tax=Brugia malayi TaxID=6279 RepID=A0A4E9F4P2_BRUMA|nr:kinesin family member 12, putative [Brugia malayi]VIO90229.1 kinesin family member 12, putative [Brugia malayi]